MVIEYNILIMICIYVYIFFFWPKITFPFCVSKIKIHANK